MRGCEGDCVLQCVAVSCLVLQYVAVSWSLPSHECSVEQCVAVFAVSWSFCCSVLQCVAVPCSLSANT